MHVEARTFPKRRKVASEKFVFQPSTLDKLIVGIWEQVVAQFFLKDHCLTLYAHLGSWVNKFGPSGNLRAVPGSTNQCYGPCSSHDSRRHIRRPQRQCGAKWRLL